MPSLNIQSADGRGSGVLDRYFPPSIDWPSFSDGTFGHDQTSDIPLTITFNIDLWSVGFAVNDTAPNDTYRLNANNVLLSAERIYAEFYNASGTLLGTRRLTDGAANGYILGAYYNRGDFVATPDWSVNLWVHEPIRSIKIYVPKEYRSVIYWQFATQLIDFPPLVDPITQIDVLPVDSSGNEPITTVTNYTYTGTMPYTAQFGYLINTKITVRKMTISILPHLLNEARAQIDNTYGAFVDDERENKLLLNFGSDYQKVIVNKKLSNRDSSKLVIKLLTPLEPFVSANQPVFISREVAKTVIEKIKIELPPLLNPNPWLRLRMKYANI